MNSKSNDMHHITVDKKSNSFKVGVSIKRGVKIFKETFCRTQYGTQKATIAAAKKKRDQNGERIYGAMWPNFVVASRAIYGRNRTGVIGVSFCKVKQMWRAVWQEQLPDGTRKQRKADYSVAEYGPRGAKMRAIVRREVEVERNCVTVFLPKKRSARPA